MSAGSDSEPAYTAAVLMLYLGLPDTPMRSCPPDLALSRKLHREEVPLSLIESALLLGTLRRLTRNTDLPPLSRVRSLAYFLPVIAELQHQPLPDGYVNYLRAKLNKLAKIPAPCSENYASL